MLPELTGDLAERLVDRRVEVFTVPVRRRDARHHEPTSRDVKLDPNTPPWATQMMESMRNHMRDAPKVMVALQALANALIVVALTRPRAREFFEARRLPDA